MADIGPINQKSKVFSEFFSEYRPLWFPLFFLRYCCAFQVAPLFMNKKIHKTYSTLTWDARLLKLADFECKKLMYFELSTYHTANLIVATNLLHCFRDCRNVLIKTMNQLLRKVLVVITVLGLGYFGCIAWTPAWQPRESSKDLSSRPFFCGIC